MDRKANIIAYGTLWAVIALLAIGGVVSAAHAPDTTPRVCFPAAKWGPAPRSDAPCVKVTRVYEDGSFSFAVSDKGGTIRYTSGVGALDR